MKSTIQTPGTALLAGDGFDYFGEPVIVGALDRYTYIEIEESEHQSIKFQNGDEGISTESTDNGFTITGEIPEKYVHLKIPVEKSIFLSLQYIISQNIPTKSFTILVDTIEHHISSPNNKTTPASIGEESAVITGVIGAMFKLHEMPIDTEDSKMTIAKIGIISKYLSSKKHEDFWEIVGSVFGGALFFSPPDFTLLEELCSDPIDIALTKEWQGFEISPLPSIPQAYFPCTIVQSIPQRDPKTSLEQFRKDNSEAFETLRKHSKEVVTQLQKAFTAQNTDDIVKYFEAGALISNTLFKALFIYDDKDAFYTLQKSSEKLSIPSKMTRFSGGSGIACLMDQFKKEDLEWDWEESTLSPLDVYLSQKGLSLWF